MFPLPQSFLPILPSTFSPNLMNSFSPLPPLKTNKNLKGRNTPSNNKSKSNAKVTFKTSRQNQCRVEAKGNKVLKDINEFIIVLSN